MKLSKTVIVFLALGAVSTLAVSCAPKQNVTPATQSQVVTIGRGDLSVDITAAGNLALADKEDLAFDIPGTVQDVLVDEGDSVKKGQVLARLDTSEWEKQLTALTRQVTTAERQVTVMQKQLRDKQTAVTAAQNAVTSKEFARRGAQLDFQSAQDALSQITDVKKIQDQIDNAQATIDFAKKMLLGQFGQGATIDSSNYWMQVKQNAEIALAQAKKDMADLLSGTSLTVSTNVLLDVAKKQLAVDQKQLGITQAQLDLDNAKVALEDAQNAIVPAQQDLQNAQDDLQTAKDNLSDAKAFGPEVKSPFDGFVTKVNVKGGDDVKKGTIAATVADPAKFEADVLVGENDISKVRLGALASIELQSLAGSTFSANITHIAPTATIQQGVVNYKVTISLQSLRPVTQAQRQTSANRTAGNAPGGVFIGRGGGTANLTQQQIAQLRQQAQGGQGAQAGGFGGAFGGANLTQEQRNQLLQQRQQALANSGLTQEQIAQLREQAAAAGLTGGQFGRQGQTAAVSAANIRLAEGMTVTVTIPVDSRSNVVLVPNGAVTTKSGQTSVKVSKVDGTTEDRVIETGISSTQYTEVISGLNEGDKVVITRTTSTTSSTNTNRQGNQPRVPGGGGFFIR